MLCCSVWFLSHLFSSQQQSINLVAEINEKYLAPAMVTLSSFAKHNDANINLSVIHDGSLTEKHKNDLKGFISSQSKNDINVSLININEKIDQLSEPQKGIVEKINISVNPYGDRFFALARILLPVLIPEADFLHIDMDMLFQKSILKMYNFALQNDQAIWVSELGKYFCYVDSISAKGAQQFDPEDLLEPSSGFFIMRKHSLNSLISKWMETFSLFQFWNESQAYDFSKAENAQYWKFLAYVFCNQYITGKDYKTNQNREMALFWVNERQNFGISLEEQFFQALCLMHKQCFKRFPFYLSRRFNCLPGTITFSQKLLNFIQKAKEYLAQKAIKGSSIAIPKDLSTAITDLTSCYDLLKGDLFPYDILKAEIGRVSLSQDQDKEIFSYQSQDIRNNFLISPVYFINLSDSYLTSLRYFADNDVVAIHCDGKEKFWHTAFQQNPLYHSETELWSQTIKEMPESYQSIVMAGLNKLCKESRKP